MRVIREGRPAQHTAQTVMNSTCFWRQTITIASAITTPKNQ